MSRRVLSLLARNMIDVQAEIKTMAEEAKTPDERQLVMDIARAFIRACDESKSNMNIILTALEDDFEKSVMRDLENL